MSVRAKLLMAKYAWRLARDRGMQALMRSVLHRNRIRHRSKRYQKWISMYDTITGPQREEMIAVIERMPHKPLISIVMPVYNIEEKWLRQALDSVLAQIYPNWELCIADDNSPDPRIVTPWADVIQPLDHEIDDQLELNLLKEKWIGYFENDPYYNPNLTIDSEDLDLAFPPRLRPDNIAEQPAPRTAAVSES